MLVAISFAVENPTSRSRPSSPSCPRRGWTFGSRPSWVGLVGPVVYVQSEVATGKPMMMMRRSCSTQRYRGVQKQGQLDQSPDKRLSVSYLVTSSPHRLLSPAASPSAPSPAPLAPPLSTPAKPRSTSKLPTLVVPARSRASLSRCSRRCAADARTASATRSAAARYWASLWTPSAKRSVWAGREVVMVWRRV